MSYEHFKCSTVGYQTVNSLPTTSRQQSLKNKIKYNGLVYCQRYCEDILLMMILMMVSDTYYEVYLKTKN